MNCMCVCEVGTGFHQDSYFFIFLKVRFEVVTSEASYCHSLDIVVEHFVKCKPLQDLLGNQDRNWLFSRLLEVRAISHRYDPLLALSF